MAKRRKVNTDQLKDNAVSVLQQRSLKRTQARTTNRRKWIAAIPDDPAPILDTTLLDARLKGRKGLPREWAIFHVDKWLMENVKDTKISRRQITSALVENLAKKQDFDMVIPEFAYRGNSMDVMAIQGKMVIEYRILLSRQELSNEIARGVQMAPNKVLNYHANLRLGSLLPNAFYFVIVDGYIDPKLLPAHAGIIRAVKSQEKGLFEFTAIRTPQELHHDFIPTATYKMLAELLYKRIME